MLTGKNIPFTTKIKQGKVYEIIIETAGEVKADFIFMGRTDSSDMMKNFAGTNTMHIIRGADVPVIMTQQELHITEYFIGSVAQDIINLSDFPVLSINPLVREEKGIPDPMAEVFINPIQMLDHR